ncbi:MAG: hypothetical protein ACOCZ5_01785 [bacterium]
MSLDHNIKIITDSGEELDYISAEDLGITFNRIIDDNLEVDKRWGEYSYSFSLPKTKNNARIFKFAGVHNTRNKFKNNRVNISIYNKNELVVSGILELESIEEDSYECSFYSKLTQLIDELEDLTLKDITTMPIIDDFKYEETIADHINANYKSSDDTSYQFPLVFYNTYFTPYNVYSTLTDFEGYDFREDGDRAPQNFYYILNKTQTGNDNEFYFHQFPPAFYLKSVIKALFKHIGWGMSGSFWENEDIKKIIMLYSGENDIYDSATLWKNDSTDEYIKPTGDTFAPAPDGYSVSIDLNQFLPDVDAQDFIKSIINTFNLYMFVDVNNQIVTFETYDLIFTNRVSPYKLDNKIDQDSIVVQNTDESKFSILFNEPNNKNHLGDNYYINSSSTNALELSNYTKTSNEYYDSTYNYKIDADEEIEVGFAAPKVKRMFIRNVENFAGDITDANDHVIFIPDMSEQTRYDNNNTPFNKDIDDTTVNNTEETIKFKGEPTLMFYYGISDCDFEQDSGKGSASDYFYINFNNTKQKIPIASPFALINYRDRINKQLDRDDDSDSIKASMYASYLQTIYLNMGDTSEITTDFSLIFSNSYGLANTLTSKFYNTRINRYENSEIIEADIRINNVDWINLTLNQPLIYRDELYSLMELSDYNIIENRAKIKMIKMI